MEITAKAFDVIDNLTISAKDTIESKNASHQPCIAFTITDACKPIGYIELDIKEAENFVRGLDILCKNHRFINKND